MKRLLITSLLLVLSFAGLATARAALSGDDRSVADLSPDRVVVTEAEFLGWTFLPTGTMFEDTEVGGLSAVAYDAGTGRYYLLSDDRSAIDPARFYTANIDIADMTLVSGDVMITGVTTLTDGDGQPFAEGAIDPEGMALTEGGTLYIASEGAADDGIPPFVREFALNGKQIRAFTIPDKFIPNEDGTYGVRNNLAFESLTLTPAGDRLFTATENALAQDGPVADLDQVSLSRVLAFDTQTGQPGQEVVYVTEPVATKPKPPGGARDNSLVEMLALDNNGSFLTLERSYSEGKGVTVKLFYVRAQGALDVSAVDDLIWDEEEIPFEIDPPVAKVELLDLADLDLPVVDNFEGMGFGPTLADGRPTILLVSDNNFNPLQSTQFLALALTTETLPAALPTLETPYTLDDEDAPDDVLKGDSDDPAIWVHPTDPSRSMVIFGLKDGGLLVLGLGGKVLQTIAPEEYGDFRYNNVDLLYNFPLGGEKVDLAVASDRENDTLAVFAIDQDARQVTDVTSDSMPETIFGVDDGEQTAYGLAAYPSPVTGRQYVFVTQADGALVAQLELTDDGTGKVTAEVVRTLELPVPTGDPADSQSEGSVADRQLGFYYVALEGEVGVLKYNAEPDGGDDYTVIQSIDESFLEPDIEGLTIYYGPGTTGYLLVSSQGDHSYAVLSRDGDNEYLGSFIVGDAGPIDQANESDGADVINVALGPAYPQGLLVVQDGANDPQNAVEDDEQLENNSTNFKYVPWQSVAGAFEDDLMIDTGAFNPRYPMRMLLPTVSR
jgi:myo-inositol-hexaphosphate 3-phosphohydrolase